MLNIKEIPGVTVINKEEIIEEKHRTWFLALYGIFFFSFFFVCSIEIPVQSTRTIVAVIYTFLLVFFPAIMSNTRLGTQTCLTGRHRYTVTLDEAVTLASLEGYTVTKNEDGTYTLEEKEEKNRE